MNRVLSWKLNEKDYFAYIFKVDEKTYIKKGRIEGNDSSFWEKQISKISSWSPDVYFENYSNMIKEAEERGLANGINFPTEKETVINSFYNYASGTLPTNIVMLAGKDGSGSVNGSGSGSGNNGSDLTYDELKEYTESEFNKCYQIIEEQNEKVKQFIESEVTEEIVDAKKEIYEETLPLLDNIRTEFNEKLSGANSAIEKLTEVFGNGDITADDIKDILTDVSEYSGWVTTYSGIIFDIKTDYDIATGRLGEMGAASSATDGLFSRFATSLNAYSGTIGNVESWIVASAATIGDMASWYDTNASSVTVATSIINASAGTITDTIKHIEENIATEVMSQLDGVSGSILNSIKTQTEESVNSVKQTINGLSAYVSTELVHMDTFSSGITSVGNTLNAALGTFEQNITKDLTEISGITYDLREHWSVESGKLSTVATLTAETDENGNIIYYSSANTANEERVVTKNSNGVWVDKYGDVYDYADIYPHFSDTVASYIQQQSSAVTISVMNTSGLTAAIMAAIERGENGEEESIIRLIGDKVVIPGTTVANAIIANTANIGGIVLGENYIKTTTTTDGKPNFLLDGTTGNLSVKNANIEGSVSATSGYFKGDIEARSLKLGSQDIEDYVSGFVTTNINFPITDLGDCVQVDVQYGDEKEGLIISKDGLLTANNAIIQGVIIASSGYIGNMKLENGALTGPNFEMSNTGLTLRGSITQLYTEIDLSNPNYFSTDNGLQGGNFFFTGNKIINGQNSSNKLPSLLCDKTQIGRHISITNNISGIITNDFAVATMTLPANKYFFEDGRRNEMLRICNEIVELVGYGSTDNSEFYGWTVLNRRPFLTEKSYGHPIEALCTGVIDMNSGYIEKFNSFDGTEYVDESFTYTSFDKTKLYSLYWNGAAFEFLSTKGSSKNYYVRMPDTWFDRTASTSETTKRGDNADVFVQLTPIDALSTVCYKNTSASGFTIQSSENCKVGFTIYNRGSWRCLPKKQSYYIVCKTMGGGVGDDIRLKHNFTMSEKFEVITSPENYSVKITEGPTTYQGNTYKTFDELFTLEYYTEWDYDLCKYRTFIEVIDNDIQIDNAHKKTIESYIMLTLVDNNGNNVVINNGGNPITVEWKIELQREKNDEG